MTRIVHDTFGTKTYEMALHRGVLYPAVGPGVAWNGLVSVDEAVDDVKQQPYYIDGVKYFSDKLDGDWAASLKAITFPDEFLLYDGYQNTAAGLTLTNQPANALFGLSYQTRIGNDYTTDLGNKIHILYNLTATPSSRGYTSLGKTADPSDFGWDLAGIPEAIPGFRPTVHFIVDSRKVSANAWTTLGNVIYGTATVNPRLPTSTELFTLTKAQITSLVDNGDGTYILTAPDDNLVMTDANTFSFNSDGATVIDANTYSLTDGF